MGGSKSDGGVAKKSGRFLPKAMKKSMRQMGGKSATAATPSEEEPSKMKVAIVSQNRTTGPGASGTPATAASTPGAAANGSPSLVGDAVSSVLNQMGVSSVLDQMNCGVMGDGGAPGSPENSAEDQMKKIQSGRKIGGEKFARAPVWGLAPSPSDDSDEVATDDGSNNLNKSYDDIELVLQQTPERGGAGAAAGPPSPIKTPDVSNTSSPSPSRGTDLATALEAEAEREREAVVNAARKELLKNKEESRARQMAAATAAGAAAAGAAAAASHQSRAANNTSTGAAARPATNDASQTTAQTNDFVDASVASALETWRSATDPKSGRTYYYNRVTKETKWDPPPELVNAYRSVVAKKAAMAAAAGGTAAAAAANRSDERQQGGSQARTVSSATGASSAAESVPSSRPTVQEHKKGKSIRKMLGIKKSNKGAKVAAAAAMGTAGATRGVNGAEDEMPDDEKSDLEASRDVGQVDTAGSGVLKNPMKAVRSMSSKAGLSLKSKTSKDRGFTSRKGSKTKKKKEHGWRSAVDPASGKTYYYHTATKETRWDKPEDLDEKKDRPTSAPKKKSPRKKRAIWKTAADPKSGKTYYYHTITKEVSWVKPAGFDEQEENLRREREERKKRKAEEKKRAAPDSPPRTRTASSSQANVSVAAFNPVNLEVQKALATALPDEPDKHDKLLEQYNGREDDLLVALGELQEDTPFDECIEYDAVIVKMDQIEDRKSASSNILAIASSAVTAVTTAATGAAEVKKDNTSAIGLNSRTYSGVTGVTGGTGMTGATAKVNNTTTKASLGVPTIAEDAEDAETSISSIEDNNPPGTASDRRGTDLEPRQESAVVRNQSQRSQPRGSPSRQTGMAANVKLNDNDSYAGDNDTDGDDYSVSDSVSALSTDIEFAGLRSRQARRKKKALGEAMEKQDWNKAASLSNELSKVSRERSDDSNQKGKFYRNVNSGSSSRKDSSNKEFSQSKLDEYIAQNDWNSVAQYIAVMRSTSDNSNIRQTSRREIRPSATYDSSRYSESNSHLPRKQVGARSQLQHEYLSDSSWDSESDSDSQASDASDWESLTSGPSASYSRPRDGRRKYPPNMQV